ncbi:hypothetical protein Slu03_20900 [Sediminihabitans luteus]|nr:hypothetical protein Slu03_20900 [Sediminihabitans luteus]
MVLEFDTVEPDDAHPPAAAPAEESRVAARAGRRRVRWWLAGLVVVGVVGAMAAADRWHERSVEDRLADSEGGVTSLGPAPSVLWTTDGVGDVAMQRWDETTLLVGTEVVAIDPGTGEERWTARLGKEPACGSPTTVDGSWTRTLTCVSTVDGDATATVLDDRGRTLGERTFEDVAGVAAVAGDGVVAEIRRVDGPGSITVPRVSVDGATRGLATVRAVEVTIRDVRAGEALAVTRVDPTPQDQACPGETTAAPGVEDDGRVLVLADCGLDAYLSPTGVRLDDPEVPGDSVVALGDGTSQRRASAGSWGAVVDADGAEVWRPEGEVLRPVASDGASRDVVLVREPSGVVKAFDGSHRELWSRTVSGATLLVQASGTVVMSGPTSIVALDLDDGDEVWRLPMRADTFVAGGLTDGEHAIVRTATSNGGPPTNGRLAALRLESGSADWTVPIEGDAVLTAVDGAVLLLVDGALERLG